MLTVLGPSLAVEIGIIATIGFLFWFFVLRVLSREKKLRKEPFTKGLLNSAGESSLKQVSKLNEVFTDHLITLVALAGFLIGYSTGIFTGATPINIPLILAMVGIGGVIVATLVMLKIRNNARLLFKYRLGLDGERHTAQALWPLLNKGYNIYHDLLFEKPDGTKFNIDHVLLGPSGVIAIETKARSKDPLLKGKDSVALKYDGKKVLFPSGAADVDCLNQALASGKTLSKELTRAEGATIPVRTAVCFPGWFVTVTAPNVDPYVCNPEMLGHWVEAHPPHPFDSKTMKRIQSRLEKLAALRTD